MLILMHNTEDSCLDLGMYFDMLILMHDAEDSCLDWMWNLELEEIWRYHYFCKKNWQGYLLCDLWIKLYRVASTWKNLEKPGIEFQVWKTWKKHVFLSKPEKTWKNHYLKKPFLHCLLLVCCWNIKFCSRVFEFSL